jgi:putative ABC transport system substrate-binding protein
MKRREFIRLLGGAAAWPVVAGAQQTTGKIQRIGVLANDPAIPKQAAGEAFIAGLGASGFVAGKNVQVEYRFAEGRLDRYTDLVAELLRLNADVIVSSNNDATLAAKQATARIPIVMLNVTDPIGQKLVTNLARPDGNITGMTYDQSAEIAAKRMQLLKDAIPRVARIGVLMNSGRTYDLAQWEQLELAAISLSVELRSLEARNVGDIETVVATSGADHLDALFVTDSGLNFANRRLIMELATKRRLPAMSNFKESTEAGGLMSYGPNRVDIWREAGVYVGKILNGAKPGDLPIKQPTKYELVINLKSARLLNLEIPRPLLLIADEVIE